MTYGSLFLSKMTIVEMISGGTARRITSGPAFDVQPRFSPDGRRISFTSDRAGGDNIWTMAVDGTDARTSNARSHR